MQQGNKNSNENSSFWKALGHAEAKLRYRHVFTKCRKSPGSICCSSISAALGSVCPTQQAYLSPTFLSSQDDTANFSPPPWLSLAAGTTDSDRRSSGSSITTCSKYNRPQLYSTHTTRDINLLRKYLCGITWMLMENVCHCLGAPATRSSTSDLSDQSRSFVLPVSCQPFISHSKLFNGGCHFSVKGAKRYLFGIKDIIFCGFWLCYCFDFIILLQELGAKAGDIFQSASLRKCHNKLSCQCSSHTHAKNLHAEMAVKHVKKREMQTENSRFWAYVHMQLSYLKYVLVLALQCLAAAS